MQSNSYLYRHLILIFHIFYFHSEKELKSHKILIDGFKLDLDGLSKIPIHSSISQESAALLDFVPQEKVYTWYKQCLTSHSNYIS